MEQGYPTKGELLEPVNTNFKVEHFCFSVWDRINEINPDEHTNEDYNQVARELFDAKEQELKAKAHLAKLAFLRAALRISAAGNGEYISERSYFVDENES